MFEFTSKASIDPILGIQEDFHKDNRINKLNLSIGIYKDETGKTPILNSVKKAEKLLLETETNKNYLNIDGNKDFSLAMQKLLFNTNKEISSRAFTIQTIGGTGALRIAADFLIKNTNIKRIWISKPSWPNHKNIFHASGLEICNYNYYDEINNKLNFSEMLNSLKDSKLGDAILFQGCCHNPTGTDPSKEQWKILSMLSKNKGLIPIFDFAYQGLSYGLKDDTIGLKIFCKNNNEIIVCSSCSKIFSLYNERVGSCTFITSDLITNNKIISQLKNIIRANYSNPPAHGAAIVTTILSNKYLRINWENELSNMRERIKQMRKLFVKTLIEKKSKKNFSFINKQNGMFSFSGLNKKQIIKLKNKYGVYIVNSGRINIAGMTPNNMSQLCKSILRVI